MPVTRVGSMRVTGGSFFWPPPACSSSVKRAESALRLRSMGHPPYLPPCLPSPSTQGRRGSSPRQPQPPQRARTTAGAATSGPRWHRCTPRRTAHAGPASWVHCTPPRRSSSQSRGRRCGTGRTVESRCSSQKGIRSRPGTVTWF